MKSQATFLCVTYQLPTYPISTYQFMYWVGSFVTFLCLNYQLAFDLPLSYLPIHLLGWEGEKGETEEGEREGMQSAGKLTAAK